MHATMMFRIADVGPRPQLLRARLKPRVRPGLGLYFEFACPWPMATVERDLAYDSWMRIQRTFRNLN